MTLKNNNDKAITAFIISSRTSPGDVFSVEVEFAYSEGDLQFVQAIEEERLAEKIEFMRTITLLDKMLALSNDELQTYFNKDLKADLSTALNMSKKNWPLN